MADPDVEQWDKDDFALVLRIRSFGSEAFSWIRINTRLDLSSRIRIRNDLSSRIRIQKNSLGSATVLGSYLLSYSL